MESSLFGVFPIPKNDATYCAQLINFWFIIVTSEARDVTYCERNNRKHIVITQ